MVDLTISIGTLDNYEMLEKCLRSVYQENSSNLSYEIWVVYNGSGNTTVPERIKANFPDLKFIQQNGPLGFCRTHNLVLRQCRSRYVLILDDDTIVLKGALSKMVSFMDTNPRVGIAGCKTLNPDGSFQKTFALMPSLRAELANVFRPDGFQPNSLYTDLGSARSVDWLNGSFMLVRSAVLKEVGVLDEHYYTYVCEPDWCYRIRKAGWDVCFVPDAEIIHIGGEHSIQTADKKFVNIVRAHVNRFYFFHKHYGPLRLALLRPIMIAGAIQRIWFYLLIYLLRPGSRSLARTRIKAFARVVALSLSPRPYNMPGNKQ